MEADQAKHSATPIVRTVANRDDELDDIGPASKLALTTTDPQSKRLRLEVQHDGDISK